MGPSKEKLDELKTRMAEAGILRRDIEEKFIKSSGRGGQKVNKTSSAVFLKHMPTGIIVKCGSDRSRNINRFLALRRLVEQLELILSDKVPRKQGKIIKLKKQKKRRQKRSRTKHQPTG
ncbi:MAG: peptide chain release factor-like protein [Desulfamplus sp.]|nr:peptide chain release factor-like protein [Desulfamplus sp.]MBF0257556.1 peptide chain release factor-like protein [Desulfamplus sp.]